MYLKTKGTFNKYIILPSFVYVEHMIMTLVARKYPIVLGSLGEVLQGLTMKILKLTDMHLSSYYYLCFN